MGKTGTFKCRFEGCNRTFQWKSSLTAHEETHLAYEQRPFVCPNEDCGKRFADRSKLKKHQVVHDTNRSQFPCEVPGCGKTFFRKEGLDGHMKAHHVELPFKCEYPGCDKAYATSAKLSAHTACHSEDKPFQCNHPGCLKRFTEKRLLRSHELTHNPTQRARFQCNYEGCEKSFCSRQSLQAHKLTHEVVKPFKCQLCNSSFRVKKNLEAHIRVHNGEKPFTCDFPGCNRAYPSKSSLSSHKKEFHSNDAAEKTKLRKTRYRIYRAIHEFENKLKTIGLSIESEDIWGIVTSKYPEYKMITLKRKADTSPNSPEAKRTKGEDQASGAGESDLEKELFLDECDLEGGGDEEENVDFNFGFDSSEDEADYLELEIGQNVENHPDPVDPVEHVEPVDPADALPDDF